MDRVQMETGVTGPDAPVEEVENSQEAVSERPEWLPEKFETPEALANAYGELESKMGGSTPEPTEQTPGDDETSDSTTMSVDSLQPYTDEFSETGTISDESFEKIQNDLGIPEDIARAYVEGQKALVDQAQNAVFAEFGGQEKYNEMIEWASENLSEDEIAAYDAAMDNGDMNATMMAARGLAARYAQDTGNNPNLIQGAAPSTKGGNPFGSWNQVSEAMRDPRYQKDPAFRKEVQDRLSISQL